MKTSTNAPKISQRASAHRYFEVPFLIDRDMHANDELLRVF